MSAIVVGTDASSDVALLQLQDASGLATVALDDDNGVAVGDAVTAVGNAEGGGDLLAALGSVTALDQTMTASIERARRPRRSTGSSSSPPPSCRGTRAARCSTTRAR